MSIPIEVDYNTKANLDFVYKFDRIEYKFAYNAMAKKVILTVAIYKKELSKDYPVEYFLDLLIGAHYVEISNHDNISKRFKMIYECKSKILQYIEGAKQALKYNTDTNLIYDFSPQIERVNNEIEKLKVELDVYKYDLEVKKLRIETRDYKEYLYVITAFIFILGTFFTIDKCKSPFTHNVSNHDTTIIKK